MARPDAIQCRSPHRGGGAMSKNLHENCGVFAVYDDPEAASLVALGLFALQHRGEESAGIVWSEEGVLAAHRGLGLVSEALPPAKMSQIRAKIAVGHTRYATAGG